jgi:regulator of sigma E protease
VTSIISFVVVVGILIFIHELGHFFLARWIGVGVERFSIGFGPILFRLRRGETEYCVSAIPMGGYVKMVGEDPREAESSIPTDPRKSFSLNPLWARSLIVFAGPGMNFVLAAAIFAGVFMVAGRPVLPSVLGRIQPGSPAAQAGLQTGDRVTAVEGRTVAHWDDLMKALQSSRGETVQLTIRRDSEERRLALTPARAKVKDIFGDEQQIWDLGARPHAPARVGEVLAGYPAAKAGLKAGDIVVALDGVPVFSWDELAERIHKRPGRKVELAVRRDGQSLTVSVVPQATKQRTPGGEETEVGLIGISPAGAMTYVRSNPIQAVGEGIIRTGEITALTAVGLWKLVKRELPASTIGGPLQIAVTAGEQARQGLTSLAFFTAVISVNLAILNLLPVPMLDGGHLFFFVIEAVLGRPLSIRKRELAQQVGFFFLALLMVFAVYNDILRFFK